MAFRINEAAMGRLLNSTTGPVGIYIGRKAAEVVERASENASGQIIGIETGALLRGIRAQLDGTPEGVRAVVSTDAVARDSRGLVRLYQGQPFSYPAYHDQQTGRPWLTQALRQVFP
jgi:hypothetical protein